MTSIRPNKFNAAGRLSGYTRIDSDSVESVLDVPGNARGFGKKKRRATGADRTAA